ncbi:PRKC apoptosis WT1 regulator protein isoform X1 [Oncorhynchus kisutch]|uniref:PRKC apoptosis WT1 regulator protein isoform X1 n=1 Tax=Oncorhynchus kisutch TaxID=8019 RepID=UPI0009A03EF9|nr:PRKC apoptosis WT1 regulator protein isoform X1 [Oncorhynchus kisutch]
MATGGFKPNAQTDFLEEWKAKREKMRAKMLGDIAAATGACTGGIAPASLGSHSNKSEMRNATSSTELNNNGNPDRGTSYPMARSSSSSALKRPDDDPHPTPAVRGADTPGSNLKKTPQPEKVPCTPQESSPTACNDHGSDKESPSPSKGKEKKNSGPSARKGKGQIEKRKLREKRRSTGVVSMPSTESLDELDDDDGGDKAKEDEQQLTQLNTEQNEAMTSDPGAATHLLQDTPRSGSGHHQSSSSGGPGSEEEAGGNSRHRHGNRHGNAGGLERRMEELEKELARQRQENGQLVKAHQDKDDLIGKLKEEIDLLNRDLDDIEDENEQLKQENKTLLKVVGQLTR